MSTTLGRARSAPYRGARAGRLRSALAAGVAVVAVLACVSGVATAVPDGPQAAGEPLRLRVAVAPYEPFAFERDGQWLGIDVELMQLVCAANGWVPEFYPTTFAGALDAVAAGQADAAIGGIYITPDRATRVLFSRPYVETGLVFVGRAGGPSPRAAQRVGVKRGATGERLALERSHGDRSLTSVSFESTDDSFDALVQGEVDAVLNDYLNSVLLISERYPGKLVIDRGWRGPRLLERARIGIPLDRRHPEIKQRIDATLEELEHGGTLERVRARWLHVSLPPDMSEVGLWILGALLGMAALGGAVVLLLWSRANARLLDLHMRLVETLPDAVIVTKNDAITYANPAACRLLGAADPRAIVEAGPAHFGLAAGAGERERVVRRLDGEPRTVEISSMPMRLRGRPAVQWVLRDVSELRDAQRHLKAAFERQGELLRFQEQMVETAAAWIAVTDQDGRVLLWNRAAETLSGITREEAVGSTSVWPRVLAEDWPRFAAAVRDAVTSAPQSEGIAFTVEGASGRELAMSFFFSAMGLDDPGDHIVIVGVDLTVERNLTEQLVQSQKLEAMGRLAAGVAHEFNNMLQVIMGYAEMLAIPAGRGADELGEILKAALHGAALARQLLTFGRRQPMQRQVVDVDDLVGDTQRMLRPLLGERVQLELDLGGAGTVVADRIQLQQVLLNLATNARDAMPDGGTFVIETGREADGDTAIVRVSDTGAGIPPEIIEQIFEPFFTTKPTGRGTGLGLATVHGVISQHGGSIEVDSAPGTGTRFTIRLPATEQQPRERELPRPLRAIEPDARLLLVEDDPAVRETLTGGLSLLGYRVQSAASVSEALRFGDGERPSVLLTDVQLGDGSGFEVVRALRGGWPELPVCFLTGYGRAAELEDAAEQPRTAVLGKPCSLGDLAATLRRLTGE